MEWEAAHFRGNADELAIAPGVESPTIKFHFRRSGARVSNADGVRGPHHASKSLKYDVGAEEERRAECEHLPEQFLANRSAPLTGRRALSFRVPFFVAFFP